MVEGAPLLREYTREGIVGSNPILSAIKRIFPDIDILNICRIGRTKRLLQCTSDSRLSGSHVCRQVPRNHGVRFSHRFHRPDKMTGCCPSPFEIAGCRLSGITSEKTGSGRESALLHRSPPRSFGG